MANDCGGAVRKDRGRRWRWRRRAWEADEGLSVEVRGEGRNFWEVERRGDAVVGWNRAGE
jgi:hypothetical protein